MPSGTAASLSREQMVLCLDTTFLADLLSSRPAAVEFAASVHEPAVVSAVSFYELLWGALGQRRLGRVESFRREYAVLPADYGVCALAATLQRTLLDGGGRIPDFDAIIAATALLADATVVTRDTHFARVPARFALRAIAY